MHRKRPVVLVWRTVNPLMRYSAGFAPWQVLVETTGRRSGRRRLTPLALGRRDATGIWVVAVHGRRSGWMLNAETSGRVRLRHKGRWSEATTHIHDWDAATMATMSRLARTGLRAFGDQPLLVQFRPMT